MQSCNEMVTFLEATTVEWCVKFLFSSRVPLGRYHRHGVLISILLKVHTHTKKRPFVSTWRRCFVLLMIWESVVEDNFHLLSVSVITRFITCGFAVVSKLGFGIGSTVCTGRIHFACVTFSETIFAQDNCYHILSPDCFCNMYILTAFQQQFNY